MLTRILYTSYQWWRHHSQLRSVVVEASKQINNVLELNASALHAQGVQHVVLDVDGVLTPHGQTHLSPEVAGWLNQLHQDFHGCIFILTNNPYGSRLRYLQQTFSFLKVIQATRKKPYPDGLLQVIREMQCNADQVVMVDDRLATGCLAACIAGVQVRWVTQPMIDFKRHRCKEYFFIILRRLDKLLIIK